MKNHRATVSQVIGNLLDVQRIAQGQCSALMCTGRPSHSTGQGIGQQQLAGTGLTDDVGRDPPGRGGRGALDGPLEG